MKHDHKHNRVTFASKLGIVAATAGSAVGLGNIWRFPSEVAGNGGAIFIFIYLGCVLFLGMPLMISEMMIGRASKANASGAFTVLRPKSYWNIVGIFGILTCFLILGYYFVVCGWTLNYLWNSITGDLMKVTDYSHQFYAMRDNSKMLIWLTILFCCGTLFFVLSGVKKGIERSSKFLMPLLLILLVCLSIRSLTLSGAIDGLVFLFKPDASKVHPKIFIDAVGQAFFSLSVAIGVMITYGSYFKKDVNIPKTSVEVSVVDTIVAILGGLVIFPSAFALASASGLGQEQVQQKLIEGGAGLLFITVPNLFKAMPLASLWSTLFFLLLGVAALTTTISYLEAVTVFVKEELHLSRTVSGIIVTALIILVAYFAIGSANFFEQLDNVASNIFLPIGGMFTCIFVGWILERNLIEAQFTNSGTLRFSKGLVSAYLFLVKYLVPLAIFMMFAYAWWPK